jgi:hypothetical protein
MLSGVSVYVYVCVNTSALSGLNLHVFLGTFLLYALVQCLEPNL